MIRIGKRRENKIINSTKVDGLFLCFLFTSLRFTGYLVLPRRSVGDYFANTLTLNEVKVNICTKIMFVETACGEI